MGEAGGSLGLAEPFTGCSGAAEAKLEVLVLAASSSGGRGGNTCSICPGGRGGLPVSYLLSSEPPESRTAPHFPPQANCKGRTGLV